MSTEPTITEIIASLLAHLELHGLNESLTWDSAGRDYELVWGDAGDTAIDATIWDETDPDRDQIATVRLTVQVIA
jgi:hypothetical protein